jgi:Vacuolar protein sorting-associated protein 62
MPSADDLLAMYQPVLKYDSQETYFADSAAEWTDNPGDCLIDSRGETIATAGNGLSLARLASAVKAATANAADVVSDPGTDYVTQANLLHANPLYANQIYGRSVVEGSALWLQYWFYYFYNDYNLIGTVIKAGLHECDWEMIQLRLPDQQTPDLAVYAQHDHAQSRDWRQIDRLPGTSRPIVYPARGSHASYFEPGTHWTGVWFDYADGKRASPDPKLAIVREDQDEWLWMRWPGFWGDTKRGPLPIDSDSPRSPGHHGQWDRPSSLLEKPPPAPPSTPQSPLAPPAVRADWAGQTIRISYDVTPPAAGKLPTVLTVTVNSPDEPAPPTTRTYSIANATGAVDWNDPVQPTNRYDIYVSCATTGTPAIASASVRVDLEPATS